MRKITQFTGRRYETGSVHNLFRLQDITAPHTKAPYSEAFLLGISGGIAFGYFTFEYMGQLPHVALLTHNTFGPLQTLLERLGVEQQVYQTTKSEIAEKKLMEVLNSGMPALVWADECSLPYSSKKGTAYWNMAPVVVFGVDGDEVLVADRAARPFRVKMEALTRARARVKDDKYRIVTLGSPSTSKLVSAVQKGIWQCISLFTDKPPKGARTNFGFAAYEHLAEMLVNKRNKHSWERLFPAGAKLFNALAGTAEAEGVFAPPGMYTWIQYFSAGDGAERALYADFLDEAAILLEKKSLKDAAKQFRLSHKKWLAFADALLPSGVPALAETKKLLIQKHQAFIENADGALEDIKKINSRLKQIESDMADCFPLNEAQTANFRAELREHVLGIAATEKEAVEIMSAASL